MSDSDKPSFLLVDDDSIFRERLSRALRDRGFDVRQASDYQSAMEEVERESPEYAVIDLRMPGETGLELLQAMHRHDSDTEVVMLTGYGSIASTVDAMRLGAVNYIPKPADADEILFAFEKGRNPPVKEVKKNYATPSLARTEWEHINRVVNDCGGNISEAARRLKIHRRSLQRKLNKYPVSD